MMFPLLVLTTSLFIGSTEAQFDNMDDDDFSKFLQFHDNVGSKHGESAGKGCVTGAIGAAPGGFAALCIGCGLGAAGNVASDVLFPEKKK